MADEEGSSLRDRLARQSEEALGRIASDLLENPLVNSAIAKAFSAREKAASAQEAAMGVLNLPSAADIDRLTRRLRTVGTRLEGIEEALDRLQDGVDQLADRLEAASRSAEPGVAARVAAIEGQLSKLVNEVGHVSDAIEAGPVPVHREQERLAVDDAPPKPKPKPAAKKAAENKRAAIEGQLSKLVNEMGHVSDAIEAGPVPVHREQERLAVDDAPPKPKPAAKKAAENKRAAS